MQKEGKHRYKQTENINHFLRFIRSVGMPEVCSLSLWQSAECSPIDVHMGDNGSLQQAQCAQSHL